MNSPGRCFIILFLSFTTILFAINTFAQEVTEMTPAYKDLKRWPDPVIMAGSLLQEMHGRPVSHLRLYAFCNGRFEPIRYQVDEMTGEDGDWVLSEGPLSNEELGNETFDPWDKLLFMASDTGDRATKEIWTKGYTIAKEIEIVDPLTGEKGWCYLFYYASNPPPRSPLPDYIFYDYDTEILRTDYLCGQNIITEDGEHSNYYKYLIMPEKAGGNGKNMADRLKIRITIKLFFGSFTIKLSEGRIKGDTLAYKKGPIRLIRRLEQYVLLPGGIKVLRAVADINQFRNIGNCPAIFQLPFRMDRFVSSFALRTGTDYSKNAFGSMIYNSNNLEGIIVDGKMSEMEHNFNPAFDDWRLITGDIGTFMNRTVPFPEVKKHINITMGIIDDVDRPYPPEAYPGSIGYLWQESELGKAPKGRYVMFLEFYWIPNFKPGDQFKYLNYLDHPLKIRVDDQEAASQTILITNLGEKYK